MTYTNSQFPAIRLACGAKAVYDQSSGCGYRCIMCFCVVGSVGMPLSCKLAMEAEQKRNQNLTIRNAQE